MYLLTLASTFTNGNDFWKLYYEGDTDKLFIVAVRKIGILNNRVNNIVNKIKSVYE